MNHEYLRHIQQPLSHATIADLQQKTIADFSLAAPDLTSNNLAHVYIQSLFQKLLKGGACSIQDFRTLGAKEFFNVGRDVLGPLAVTFVDQVLQSHEGIFLFPARDATPFFHIANVLKNGKKEYQNHILLNPTFNRKLWGVNDEQEQNGVKDLDDPMVARLLHQMGFGQDTPKIFVEVGAWGTMTDKLKQYYPDENYVVYFLFSHMPQNIFGFMNANFTGNPAHLETIADTWEAFPKFHKRTASLTQRNGQVVPELNEKYIQSHFMLPWTLAALNGVQEAAVDYLSNGQKHSVEYQINQLIELSHQAQKGIFTGVLPHHTETWTEGNEWIEKWRWGKISPLS